MTLDELKAEVKKYQYIEDENIIDVTLASIIATRLKLGDPIWLIIIGASSGGKSQILRPMAMTDAKFMHRIDDLTENTFLSAMKTNDGNNSLLQRIGERGIMVISDLTVIFSKSAETRATILSQFRMIYDGEMTKFSGNMKNPITWKGYLGVLAGSTPSIYAAFEEVADMGERFIYYRMKDYDPRKATRLALGRKIFGRDLDKTLSSMYEEYIKEVVASANTNVEISDAVNERIIEISLIAERIRTSVSLDWKGEKISKVPVAAMPMRVALQLTAIAKGLYVMRGKELDQNDLAILDWCAWSLGNEEKRSCLAILAYLPLDVVATTQTVADKIGLDTPIIRNVLQNLSAVGILERSGGGEGLTWKIKHEEDYHTIRRINNITGDMVYGSREITSEEKAEMDDIANKEFDDLTDTAAFVQKNK